MRLCHLHLPRFPIQRCVLERPSLAQKPFVLEREWRGQRQVVFASGPALKAGIGVGMTLAAARARLPKLAHFPYVPEAEGAALLSLGEALLAVGPAFQLSSPEGLWLEASAAHLWGGERGLCERALTLCKALGYVARATVASGLFTGRALARWGKERVCIISPVDSARALRTLPLSVLEGLFPIHELGSLGLSTLGEVAALPSGAVAARMGKVGLQILKLCRGEDDALFVPESLPERWEETLPLDWPAESMEPLLFAFKTCFDRLGARLSGRRRAATRLTLALRLDSAEEVAFPLVLGRPNAQPKLLLELTRQRLLDVSLASPVSSVRVCIEEACEDLSQQLSLGDGPGGDASVDAVLARLLTALSSDAVFSAELVSEHLPEQAYRPKPFRPPPKTNDFVDNTSGGPASPTERAGQQRPTRLLESPCLLETQMNPAGGVVSARILGRRRRVIGWAGPERLCGQWWQKSGYERDYYRVVFEGVGAAWIYRDAADGRFYLHGMFD